MLASQSYNGQNKIGRKIAGTKFIILSFVTLSILSPKPIIIIKPTHDISAITASVSKGEITPANKVIKPWYTSTKTAENNTPTPIVLAKIIEDTKSIADFVNKIVLSPLIPACKQPTMVIAPTQNSREAEVKPCAKVELWLPLSNLFSSFLPILFFMLLLL